MRVVGACFILFLGCFAEQHTGAADGGDEIIWSLPDQKEEIVFTLPDQQHASVSASFSAPEKRWGWGRSSSSSSSRSGGSGRSRGSSSASRSSGGFRNRIRSGWNKAKGTVRSGYNRAKTKFGGGGSSSRNRFSGGGGSRSRGSSTWGSTRPRSTSRTSGFRNKIKSGWNKTKGKIKSGYSRVRNKIRGGRKPTARPRPSSTGGSTWSGSSWGGRDRSTTGIGGGRSSQGGFRNKIKSGFRGIKNKIFGNKKPKPSSGGTRIAGGRGGGRGGFTDKVKNKLKGIKDKITGGRKKPKITGGGGATFIGDRRPSSPTGGRTSIGGIFPSGPRTKPKSSLFSKIKSKALPLLKKPSTQRALMKGAKWLMRKYRGKNRRRGSHGGYGANRYSAMGIYGPGAYGYGHGGYGRGYGYPDGGYPVDHGGQRPLDSGHSGFGGEFYGRRAPEVVEEEWKSGTNKGNSLGHGDSLSSGESLMSPNGKFEAHLDQSGDFMLYSHDAEAAYWHTDTEGAKTGNYRLTLEYDNNLILRDRSSNSELWSSGTKNMGLGFAKLKMENDGSIVLSDQRNTVLWRSNYTQDEPEPRIALFNNQTMYEEDDAMASPNYHFYGLIEDGTGRMIVYDGKEDKIVWGSRNKQEGQSPFRLSMQDDNNLVMYDKDNKVVWSTNSAGKGGGAALSRITFNCRLSMQDDNNLVMYDKDNKVVWSTNSAGKGEGAAMSRITDEGKLVVQDSKDQIIWSS